ncbi:SagB family peptide dehydrogenase [Nocardia sp. NPDC058497]|uniref:SagB family peptide dehydrogenase n=1 Tax=Nocardia sp. NPDC058497 TaxID=3346529 RepID=UPI0036632BA2
MTPPAQELILSLRPGVSLVDDVAAGVLHLLHRGVWRHNQAFSHPDADYRRILRELSADAGISWPRADVAGDESAFIESLVAGGWLTLTIRSGDQPQYTLRPLRDLPIECLDGSADREPNTGDVRLSRFVVVRSEGDGVLVESPLAAAQILVHRPAVAGSVGALLAGAPATAGGESPPRIHDRLVRDLAAVGMLASGTGEDSAVDVRQWAPQDLLFHRHSRQGNGGYDNIGFGRTGWGKALGRAEPARRVRHAGAVVALPDPDIKSLCSTDIPLAQAMEERRSHRDFDDDHPIRLEQISELLFRSVRARSEYLLDDTECLSVPYPSGGAVYELETYLVVRTADGLEPGFYHYERHDHQLRRLPGSTAQADQILRTAAAAGAVRRPPQAVIVITARFGRLLRTYEGVPYALILKHVGALYQTLYLAATAAGIGICGLGAGDSSTFENAVGLDFTSEGSVGELMIGSLGEQGADKWD